MALVNEDEQEVHGPQLGYCLAAVSKFNICNVLHAEVQTSALYASKMTLKTTRSKVPHICSTGNPESQIPLLRSTNNHLQGIFLFYYHVKFESFFKFLQRQGRTLDARSRC